MYKAEVCEKEIKVHGDIFAMILKSSFWHQIFPMMNLKTEMKSLSL